MTPAEYGAALKKGLGGGYLFFGEEGYLLSHYLEATKKAFFDDPDIASFNHFRLIGEDFSPERLMEAMQALPVFSERKLIEIAQVNLNSMSEQNRRGLVELLGLLADYEYNTLIWVAPPEMLDPGSAKKPSAAFSALCEVLTPVHFERQTPAKLNKWLGQHFAANGIYAPSDVCGFLIDYSGRDMYALAAQSEKLSCYLAAKGETTLTVAAIEAVASSAKEYDAFSLADAVLAGDADRALSVLQDRERKKERPELILSGIAEVFRTQLKIRILQNSGMNLKEIAAKTGLHAYRVEICARGMGNRDEDAIRHLLALCAEADMQIKNGGKDAYGVLRALLTTV